MHSFSNSFSSCSLIRKLTVLKKSVWICAYFSSMTFARIDPVFSFYSLHRSSALWTMSVRTDFFPFFGSLYSAYLTIEHKKKWIGWQRRINIYKRFRMCVYSYIYYIVLFRKKMAIDLVSYRLAIGLAFDSPMYTFISIRKLLHDWLHVIHYLVCILHVLYFEIFIYFLFRLLVMKTN
jgi:hypothetical protein